MLATFSAQQAFFAVNQPTRVAILPRILPAELLPAANALNMTVMSAGAIAGPLVGGALIPVLGYAWLYLIDTLTLTVTLYAVWRLPRMPVLGRTGAPGLCSVIDGFRYLAWHKILLLSFLVWPPSPDGASAWRCSASPWAGLPALRARCWWCRSCC